MDINTCLVLTENLRTVAYYSHLLPVALALFLSIYALAHAKFSQVSIVFFLFTLSFSMWLLGDLFPWTSNNYYLIHFTWSWLDYVNIVFFILGASFLSILILGGATLLLKNEIFVKWKPTVVYWALAIALLGSQLFSTKPLLQRLGEGSILLPERIWRHLNTMWWIFFLLLGLTNLYVVYNFSTTAWVNFKLFGTLGLTLLFVVLQSIYMAKHAKIQKVINSNDSNIS